MDFNNNDLNLDLDYNDLIPIRDLNENENENEKNNPNLINYNVSKKYSSHIELDETPYEDLDIKPKRKKEKAIIIVQNDNNNMSDLNETFLCENRQESKKTKKSKKTFKVIPLGGLDQIGMNITAFEYGNSIVVVDCGIAFPNEATQPGVEAIIPNVDYLIENITKVKGFVITHGHEDHIGALPYIIKKLNVPIYGTPLTIGLVQRKFQDAYIQNMCTCHTVNFGETINFGDINVEFIKTNHSIVDAAALAISCKIGTIIHTGDFKVDYTPVYDDAIDLTRMAKLGEQGVLALLCDSTNATRPGFSPSEKYVGPIIDSIFDSHRKERIIVATFASNVDRVQQIINSAHKHNRRVVLEGRSMVNIIAVASALGKIHLPDKVVINEDEMKNFKDEELCIIATGSQGENMAALSRMATQNHKKIAINSNDVIVFSSHPIPGNEKSVSTIINNLERQGAKIINQDTHVSGHACQEEIKLIYSLTKPTFAIPIHGEYRHRLAGAQIAEATGVNKENIFLLDSGNVLEFYSNKTAKVTKNVTSGSIFIDSYSKEPISELVIRDRTRLAESGIVNVIVAIDKKSGAFLDGPEIMTRGFVKVVDSKDLLDDLKEKSLKILSKYTNEYGLFECNTLPTSEIQGKISDYIFNKYRKRPMVILSILEIETDY